MIKLLEKLTQCYGPSGHEDAVRDLIIDAVRDYADEFETDAMGNLIVHKKGNGKKIMAAAHMDEIGVIITAIDEKGFLRFSNIGGLETKYLIHKRVVFENGVQGVIGIEENTEKPAIAKMFIDIGAANREEAAKMAAVGDMAVFCGAFYEQGGRIISKALDNRAGCYILIRALQELEKTDNDLYFVFTVQEEVGLRGAKTAAFSIAPDCALAVDVTDTGDTPEYQNMDVKQSKGAAVKIMDCSILCHPQVREGLIQCARRHGILYQLEIMTDGGTDAGAIHLSGSGVKTGGISLPTRYIHSPAESANFADIEACCMLLKNFMETSLEG